jgi:S1-C subfamily serine protease
VAVALRDTSERPVFVKVAAPAGHGDSSAAPSSGYGPYFGSVPEFGEGTVGVKFADVREGSPAAKAGFKAGDTMVMFDGKPITNLQDFTYVLQGHKPGDEVIVKVMRNGAPIETKVTLSRRN